MATSTLQYEEEQVRDLFSRVDEVLDVARSIEGDRPREAARLVRASHGALTCAAPVRVPIAASGLRRLVQKQTAQPNKEHVRIQILCNQRAIPAFIGR